MPEDNIQPTQAPAEGVQVVKIVLPTASVPLTPVEKSEEASPVAPVEAPKTDATNHFHLAAFAESALDIAEKVASIVNPTNIFALKYQALAAACKELIDLFVERGHTGVPPSNE